MQMKLKLEANASGAPTWKLERPLILPNHHLELVQRKVINKFQSPLFDYRQEILPLVLALQNVKLRKEHTVRAFVANMKKIRSVEINLKRTRMLYSRMVLREHRRPLPVRRVQLWRRWTYRCSVDPTP